MTEAQMLAYVQAAALAVDLPMDAQRAQAVAVHLARTAGLARLLDGVELTPESELAEIFRPAEFPAEDAAS